MMTNSVHANLQAAIDATVRQREALKRAAEDIAKETDSQALPLPPLTGGQPPSANGR